jgi:hypothetical protein
MKKLTISELKKILQDKSNEELMNEIVKLYKKFPDVKDFYSLNLSKEGKTEVTKKYKKIIDNQFFPSRGIGKLKLSVARKAVNDFKKISHSTEDIADMMLYYVDNGVMFTNSYGDIYDSFYNSIETMFESALKYIAQKNLQERFYEQCKQIVEDTSGIGWGFSDQMKYLFETYLADFE